MSQSGWTALLLAGSRPGEDGFARSQGVATKALIAVAGEPMLGRVARALLASPSVRRIIILAQDADSLLATAPRWMRDEPRIATARSGEGISTSIAALAGSAEAPFPLLVVTADHALLTPAMVEAFIAQSEGADVAFALVERKLVEAAYPETRRTWLRFKGGDYCGANLFALRTGKSRTALDLWATVERDRKKAMKLLMVFGPLLALRAVTRSIGLDSALAKASRKLGLGAKAIQLPFAEAAIDVDKSEDLVLVERILAARASR